MKPTKQDWINAGNAASDIDLESVEAQLGAKIPDSAKHWEDVCAWVYKKITGNNIPNCGMRGRGFRSQWHGKTVADVWPE
jgi:hypothetical protein